MGKLLDVLRGVSLPQQTKAKVVSLDREFEEMAAKLQILETENLNLRAQVKPLERKIERFEQLQQQKAPSHTLDPIEIEILKRLSGGAEPSSHDVARTLNLHLAKAEYFLKRLEEQRYVRMILSMGEGARYAIDDRGNEYLVKNRLV